MIAKDRKQFYAMIKPNIYPKNGSWKDAPIMKNAVYAFVIVYMELLAVILVYDHWY